MSYLFEDGTSSPLSSDFIALLSDSFDIFVEFLTALHSAADLQKGQRLEERRVEAEVDRVRSLCENMARTVSSSVPSKDPVLGALAKKIIDDAKSRSDVLARELRNGAVEQLSSFAEEARAEREKAVTAFSKLLRKHDLPHASSVTSLKLVGREYIAEQRQHSQMNMDVAFGLHFAPGHRFRSPVRVGDLVPEPVLVTVSELRGIFVRSMRPVSHRLNKLVISEVLDQDGRLVLRLRRKEEGPGGDGLDLVFERERWDGVVMRIRGGQAVESPQALRDEEAQRLRPLVKELRMVLEQVKRQRTVVKDILLDGVPLLAHDCPEEVVVRYVQAMAPVYAELERHGLRGDELVLKRPIDAHRREERYVRKADLREKLERLPTGMQRFFAPFGLLPTRSQSGLLVLDDSVTTKAPTVIVNMGMAEGTNRKTG